MSHKNTMNIPEFNALARFSSDSALNNYHNTSVVQAMLNESWTGRRLIEALNQLPPSKFGLSTDMRFQQKQQQEREQRRMELIVTRTKVPEDIGNESTINLTNDSSSAKTLDSSIGNGKVRQMFNERRRGVGIDRSNPLKPITTRSSPSSSANSTVTSKTLDQTQTRKQMSPLKPVNGRTVSKTVTSKSTVQKSVVINNVPDENTRLHLQDTFNDNNNDLMTFNNTSFEDELDSPHTNEGHSPTPPIQNQDSNNNSVKEATAKQKPNIGINLNPVQTKKTPPANVKQGRPPQSKLNPKSPAGEPSSSTVKKTPKMATKWLPRTKTPPSLPPGIVACRICNRNFSEDRITKHEEICEKTALKKRKTFDASKHRVKGTEAEKFLKKPARGPKPPSVISTKHPSTTSTETAKKNSNWRKKHEEFIAAIRAAKEVQLHLARGGKLSDLPPPPPSENPDYITCPHCSRRFNEAAASRHIPKCANMLHNKPKPAARKR